jgi:hypothetical protein
MIRLVFETYDQEQELLEQLSKSLLNSEIGMSYMRRAQGETLKILRDTFFKNSQPLAEALLKPDSHGFARLSKRASSKRSRRLVESCW